MTGTTIRMYRPTGIPAVVLLASVFLFPQGNRALAQNPPDRVTDHSAPPPRREGDHRQRRGRTAQKPFQEGRHRGPPAALWQRMTEEERNEVRGFIAEHLPRMFEELERLHTRNPRQYQRRMSRVAPEVRRLMEVMQDDPEMGAMILQERRVDIQVRRLSRRYRTVESREQRERLRERVQKFCGELFDIRHHRRAIEIRKLEARLGELQARHEASAEMRKATIRRMVEENLGSPETLPADHQP